MSAPAPTKKLFFLHIQKTGGATLTGAIGNRFAERECLLYYLHPQPDLSDLSSYRYVSGHFPLDFIERFDDAPFVFTVVRDPIERALSAYSFYRTRPPEFEREIVFHDQDPRSRERAAEVIKLARENSLPEFIERAPELAAFYFGSRQARALDGSHPEPGDERLEEALSGLERCDFVGLTERLDESTDLLMRRLGWVPLAPLPRINVTTIRLQRDEVSAAGLEALRELAGVDLELHRHAAERLERDLAAWAGRNGQRSAAVADAGPTDDLRFDRAIAGAGWVGREHIGERPAFCWIGHANKAWVDLSWPRGARSLRIEIAHALEQSILESLRISVDGEVVPHLLTEGDGFVTAEARLDPPPRRRKRRTMRVTLEVDRAVRPCDVNPGSADDRLLSIAVQRIALEGR